MEWGARGGGGSEETSFFFHTADIKSPQLKASICLSPLNKKKEKNMSDSDRFPPKTKRENNKYSSANGCKASLPRRAQ